MKINRQGETLRVSEINELGLANAASFRAKMRAALASGARLIVIDLSATTVMDCSGIGALIALLKDARHSHDRISVQLVNPTPLVRQLSRLTHQDHVFETAINSQENSVAIANR